MEYEDEEQSTSPLAIIAGLGQSYTTPKAHEIATEIYDDFKNTRTSSLEAEDAYTTQADQAAAAARKVLTEARAWLQNKKQNKSRMLLAISAGLGAPTESGAFSESIGNMATNVAKTSDFYEQQRDAWRKDSDGIGLDIADLDQKLAAAKAGTQAKRREQEQKLATEALKILGREIRPRGAGSSNRSPFGKIAMDEGFIEGSPEFNTRVNQLYNEDLTQRRQAAGVDVEEEDPQSTENLLIQLGVPPLLRDPFAGLSTRDKQKALESRKKEAEGRLSEINTATNSARANIADMDRFITLNEEVPTGPIIGRIWPNTILSEAGQEMGSITARQSRNMRVPGEGPMSNYDAKQLQIAAVSRTKGAGVNKNIAKGIKAARSQQLEYAKFMNDYNVAHGHLEGADQAWQGYVQENPVFDPTKPDGSFILNPKRQTYKQYFLTQGAQTDPTVGLEAGDEDANTPAFAEGGAVEKPDTGLDRLLRSFAQGSSFNFADEMLAGLSDDPYETAIARERRMLEEGAADNPGGMLAAEVAGAVPGSLAGGYALGKLGGSGKLGKLGKLIPRSQLGRAAIAGGATGTVAGAGTSQDDGMLGEALAGGAIGSIAGPLTGLLAKYGLRGAQRIKDFATGNSMNAADRKIVEAAIKDGVDIKDIAAQVARDNKAGIPTTMADAGGRNMQGLAESMAHRTGAGPDEMLDDLEVRLAGSHERVSGHVNKALAPDEYFPQQEKLKEHLYNDAKPLYEQAYAENPGIKSQAFGILAQTEPGKKAIADAIEMAHTNAAINGIPVERSIGVFNPVTGMVSKPSLEFLDHTKRALDDMILREEKDGSTAYGRTLRQLRGKLMTELDDPKIVTPTYLKARQQYAGDLEVLQALQLGRDDFMKLAPNELSELTKNMSFAEKDALRTGVADALFNQVGKTGFNSNPATKLMGTPAMVEKLRGLFDSDAKFKKFQGALAKEAQMFDRSKRVVGAGRSARVASGDDPPNSARDLLISGGMTMLGSQGMDAIQPGWFARTGNMASRALNPMRQETIDDISRVMSSRNPADVGRPADALQAELVRLNKQLSQSGAASLRGALVGGSLAGPSPYGYIPALEEEENSEEPAYAVGGMVDRMLASSGPKITFNQSPSTPPTADDSLSSLISGLRQPGQLGPIQMGTGAARTAADMSGVDWENYGAGPSKAFFNNNAVPDPVYTNYQNPAGGATGGGGSGGASTAGGIGALIGGAKGIYQGAGALDTILGTGLQSGIKSLGGKALGALGLGSAGTAGALASIAPASTATLAGLTSTGMFAPLASIGTTAATGAAGAGAAAAGTAAAGGAGAGSLATLGAIAPWALGAVGVGLLANKAFGKKKAGTKGGYDPNIGAYISKTNLDEKGAKLGHTLTDAEISQFYGPALNQYATLVNQGVKGKLNLKTTAQKALPSRADVPYLDDSEYQYLYDNFVKLSKGKKDIFRSLRKQAGA